MRIIRDDLTGHAICALLETHFAGMLANSPKGSCHFLDFAGLNATDVTFWSIWDGDALAGCGALRELDGRHGEIKSMRTHADHLGKGVGAAMLAHIIAEARARSYLRLSLETGRGDAFVPAFRLYASAGFTEWGPFADYQPDPFSLFMTLDLE